MPRPLLDKHCERCGAAFRSRKPATRWCSRECVFAATRGPEYNAALAREYNPPRNRASRGTGTKAPYVKRDGRHEHRTVAEEKLGRPLLSGEIVHHIDEDPRNNHPDNLAVISRAEHIRIHKPRKARR